MLALATGIGDRIHRELAVYGANIVVTPKAAALEVKVGGVDLKPASGGAYLKEADLDKLHGIFWANNITGVSPELLFHTDTTLHGEQGVRTEAIGLWFQQPYSTAQVTGAPALHPWWKLQGSWPADLGEVVLGARLASRFQARLGDLATIPDSQGPGDPRKLAARQYKVSGIVSTGDSTDDLLLLPLAVAQRLNNTPGAISRVEIAARTRPEDAFARQDPATLSPTQHDIWYCRPYANSIAYQIREAIPGSDAQQVRRVEQTEGTVLQRISGLMWLISGAALLSAGFAVSAAMATAVLERRGEIGLMRSLGASQGRIASLFYAESGLLALLAGSVGYIAGSALAWWLGGRIFSADGASPLLNPVLLPIVLGVALVVAISGSTPSIRAALRTDPAATLRGGQ